MVNNNKRTTSKSFKYKAKIIESTPNNGNRLNAEVVVPSKYLSNFWRSCDLPLINCEIELICHGQDLSCVITEISRIYRAVPNTNPVRYQVTSQTTREIFQINNAKINVPIVILSVNDNINFFENIKQGFKITIFWNKYRSEITTQPKNNNLDYLIHPTFWNNRLFVLSFKNINAGEPFLRYYISLVEIKDFNVLIDNKPFFIKQ